MRWLEVVLLALALTGCATGDSWRGGDKLLHFAAGAVVAAAASGEGAGDPQAVLVAAGAGAVKEGVDSSRGEEPSGWDFLWTVAGAAAAAAAR